MGELSALPNIGKKTEAQLIEAGITTVEQLKTIGSPQAFLRIQADHPEWGFHHLCVLESAIRGLVLSSLPWTVKRELREFYDETLEKDTVSVT